MPDITDGMNEIEFLASKSLAGNLVTVTGNTSSTGAAASYTVPSGRTFVLYKAKITVDNTTTHVTVSLRNATTIRETTDSLIASAAGLSYSEHEFIIKGDTLVGDGSKTYDINVSSNGGSSNVYGTIIGYLL